VFASSGALLLCCVDRSGQLAGLRQRMREAFPGAQAAHVPPWLHVIMRVVGLGCWPLQAIAPAYMHCEAGVAQLQLPT
jgi:hypothetical protein